MAESVQTKLLRRLREETDLDIPEDAELHRTRAGRHLLAAGSWTWTLWSDTDGFSPSVGSVFTMAQVANAEKITLSKDVFGDWHVWPEPEPKARS